MSYLFSHSGKDEHAILRFTICVSGAAAGSTVDQDAELAETLGAEGAVEDALALLTEAIDITEANRTLFCGPELYRLRGSLLLAADPQDDAGGHDLEKAADLAHALGSPMLELRALISLISASPHRDSSAPLGRLGRQELRGVGRFLHDGRQRVARWTVLWGIWLLI